MDDLGLHASNKPLPHPESFHWRNDPFYRREGSAKTGSGLGLAITRKIIEKHGGNIKAVNSPEGLQIELAIPTVPNP
ncbi:MAG: hypothetical protein KKE57_06325 [Proteobacteria bacterium]|nr:hypothetical protein [Pseudomonadota bacterium]